MKLGFKCVFFAFLSASMFACVSTKDDGATDDGLTPDESIVSDADVEKTLNDVGGPIDESASTPAAEEAESTPPPAETVASDEPTEPVNAIQQDDLESYKLEDQKAKADSLTSPVASDKTPLEAAPEEKQPNLDLSAPIADQNEPQIHESATNSIQSNHTSNLDTDDKIYYAVRPGESLSMISKKLLGSVKSWKQLAKFNSIKNPNRVNAGALLKIPLTEKNRGLVSDYVARNTHTVEVKKGDTLAKIAGRVLGTKKAWKYLWKNNEAVIANPHRIEVGTVLSYLGSSKVAGVARKVKGKAKAKATTAH